MQALSIKGLVKTYRGGVHALKGIDLDVPEGAFFGLLGPNGAGKTTAIGIVSSLVNKTTGKVHVFGYDIDTEFPLAKSCIGLVPQEINFHQFEKVRDIVMNQAGFYGISRKIAKQRSEKYLKQLSLWDKRETIARNLSGGMKRRLMIARALMHEPKLLILDEPTAGVDIEIRRSMWAFLRRINAQGVTIILTTHYLEEAESLCKRIAIINHGEIVEDCSTKTLLGKLDSETFVLNLREPVDDMPALGDYQISLNDATTLEVVVKKDQDINPLFEKLSAHGIHVYSMRNKANRLEELFIRMVEDDNHG